jgi:hypothetical protein
MSENKDCLIGMVDNDDDNDDLAPAAGRWYFGLKAIADTLFRMASAAETNAVECRLASEAAAAALAAAKPHADVVQVSLVDHSDCRKVQEWAVLLTELSKAVNRFCCITYEDRRLFRVAGNLEGETGKDVVDADGY